MTDKLAKLGLDLSDLLAAAAETTAITSKLAAANESANKTSSEAITESPIAASESTSGRVGLTNCGNSCYMNAVLQMLYHIPEFKDGIFGLEKTKGEDFPLLGEPTMTLYNIFHGLDTTAAAGGTKFNPGELLNLDFECMYVIGDKIYTPNQGVIPSLLNRKFREEGIKRGAFQAENLSQFNNNSYFASPSTRKEFLATKLEANQKAIKGNAAANIELQRKALKNVKEAVESELEEEVRKLNRQLSRRRQLDATEFLEKCLFDKLNTAATTRTLLTNFTSLYNDKIVGFYNSEDFPEPLRSTNITLRNENSARVFLKHQGIEGNKVIKVFTSVRNEKLNVQPIPLNNVNSVQESIDLQFSKADLAVYDMVRGERIRGYMGMDIPKNISKKLEKNDRFNKSKRIIPERIEKETLITISPEQKYLITSLKRFQYDVYGGSSKITKGIRINKEITIKNSTIAEDNTIVSSNILMELEGIICHTGSLNGGHYFYYWKEPSGTWIEFNDSFVRPLEIIADPKYLRIQTIDDDKMVEKIAYILLYKRKDGAPTAIPADYVDYKLPTEAPSLYSSANINAAIKESIRFEQERQAREKEKEEKKNNGGLATLKNSTSTKKEIGLAESLQSSAPEESNYINNARAMNLAIKASLMPSLADLERELAEETSENSSEMADLYINFFKQKTSTLKDILALDTDILFEIAKKLPPSEKSEVLKELRTPILNKLRESDKKSGTTYIYQLSEFWSSGKAYFIPTSKSLPKRFTNYNEEAYQANKKRHENKTRGAKGGRKALRRKTRKLKQSKV